MSHHPLILVADMGATFSRIGVIDEFAAIRHVETLRSNDYPSPKEVIEAYLSRFEFPHPAEVMIAMAAPILGDRLKLTNIHWEFSIQEIAHELNTRVTFVNDFEALSLSLHHLATQDIVAIHQRPLEKEPTSTSATENEIEPLSTSLTALSDAPKVVIGTGTGFGTALTLRDGERLISLPAEGGHALYAPQDLEEIEIMKLSIQNLKRPLIVEDLLSCKEGIPRLIRKMGMIHDQNTDYSDAKGLVHAAIEEENPFAQKILHRYCAMLGNVASNIALTTGAQGGVYIGGGFVPRFTQFLQQSAFRHSFENKASVEGYLKAIPTYVITHPYATLIGLQYLLTQR